MKELEKEVEYLNSTICKDTKNHLVIRNLYGNVQVSLTGKTAEKGLKTKMFGITNGFSEPIIALRNLKACVKTGWLFSVVCRYERRS